MADLSVPELNLANPFIVAASPATQGVYGMLKSAAAQPGAIVMRNFGHDAGGGNLLLPSAEAFKSGKDAVQSHAVGFNTTDGFTSLDDFCRAVEKVRGEMPEEVKLWVSVGHFGDTVKPGVDWENSWKEEAIALEQAGADAVEVHFNTPGVAVARNRVYDFYRLIYNTTKMIKKAVDIPVMVKLPVECCDPQRAMESAVHAGAEAIGPTARWKGFVFDLDWKRTQATAGGGYGGTQMLPIICYTVAQARLLDIDTPIFAGGGVFSWEAAAKLIMSGSNCVQLGSLGCCLGPRAVRKLITGFSQWMDQSGYSGMGDLCGDALGLFNLSPDLAAKRTQRLGGAYKETAVDTQLCNGCGDCQDVCWFNAISVKVKKAVKSESCIGCGYCFQVCPTGALSVPAGDILASVFDG